MKLDEFVSQTLTQIMSGVEAAQDKVAGCGNINPTPPAATPTEYDMSRGIREVEFDVAVTVENSTATEGGVGVVVPMLALGSKGSSTDQNTTVSRIRFSVPVLYPCV